MEPSTIEIVEGEETLDDLLGRLELALDEHLDARLRTMEVQLAGLVAGVGTLLDFVASLDEVKAQLGPCLAALEKSPVFKMLRIGS